MPIEQISSRVSRLFDRHNFLRGVAVLGTGNAAGQAVAFLVTPIVSRLYTPEDFGLVATVSSIVGFISVLATWSFQSAIVLPERDDEAKDVFWLCVFLIMITCTLTTLLLPIVAPHIRAFAENPRALTYVYVIPVWLAFQGLYLAGTSWAIRYKSFRRLTRSRLTQSFASAIVKLSLGWAGLRPLGLLVGNAMTQVAGTASLLLPWPRLDRFDVGRPKPHGIWQAAKRYRRFPLLTTPTALVNSAGTQLPPLMLTALYGTRVAGWFSMSFRIATLAISIVTIPVGQAFLGEMSQLLRSDPSVMYRLFRRILRYLVLFSVIPLVAAIWRGDPLVGLVFGEQWVTSGFYLELMSIMLVASLIATPLCQVFSLLERQDLALGWNIGRAGMLVALYVWGRLADPSATTFILALSCLSAASDLVRLVLAGRIIRARSRGEA